MSELPPPQPENEKNLSRFDTARLRLSVELPRQLGRVSEKLAVTAMTGILILQMDIMVNKAELEESDPIIHTIAVSETEYNDTETMFIDGFGSQNGSWAVTSLQLPIQSMVEGRISALEQDKDGIGIRAVAREIAQAAERHNVSSINLYGYSLGGVEAIKVAAVLRDTYNITVPFIFLDRVPSDADNIKPQMRGQAATFLSLVDAFKIEGTDIGFDIQYSRILRQLFNIMSPTDISHLETSTTPFIVDQLTMAMAANTKKDVKRLASDGRPKPVLIYITSPNPESDYFVDLDASSSDFHEYAVDAGLEYVELSIDALHSRPDLSVPEYQAVFENMTDVLSLKREQMNNEYLFASGKTVHYYLRTW